MSEFEPNPTRNDQLMLPEVATITLPGEIVATPELTEDKKLTEKLVDVDHMLKEVAFDDSDFELLTIQITSGLRDANPERATYLENLFADVQNHPAERKVKDQLIQGLTSSTLLLDEDSLNTFHKITLHQAKWAEVDTFEKLAGGEVKERMFKALGIEDGSQLALAMPSPYELQIRYAHDLDHAYASGTGITIGGKILRLFAYDILRAQKSDPLKCSPSEIAKAYQAARVYVMAHEMAHALTASIDKRLIDDPEEALQYSSVVSAAYIMKHPEEAYSEDIGLAEVVEEERFAEGVAMAVLEQYLIDTNTSGVMAISENSSRQYKKIVGNISRKMADDVRRTLRRSPSVDDLDFISGPKTKIEHQPGVQEEVVKKLEAGLHKRKIKSAQQTGYNKYLTPDELKKRIEQLELYVEDPVELEEMRKQVAVMVSSGASIPWPEYVRDFGNDAQAKRLKEFETVYHRSVIENLASVALRVVQYYPRST